MKQDGDLKRDLIITDDYIFFYNGIYSQWYLRDIVINNKKFNCCEQYMMYRKALAFNDEKSAKKIMKADHPGDQKALGRAVKNFDKAKWNSICRGIVYQANWAKFTQHEDLHEELVKSHPKIIVEASPSDPIWGIGLGMDDVNIEKPTEWKGTNWLGFEIVRVRVNLLTLDGVIIPQTNFEIADSVFNL